MAFLGLSRYGQDLVRHDYSIADIDAQMCRARIRKNVDLEGRDFLRNGRVAAEGLKDGRPETLMGPFVEDIERISRRNIR